MAPMALARHFTVLLKLGLPVAGFAMVALWPEWRVSAHPCETSCSVCDEQGLGCFFDDERDCGYCIPVEEVRVVEKAIEEVIEECPLSCPGDAICALSGGNYECIELNESEDAWGGDADDRNSTDVAVGLTSGDPINNTTSTLLQIETDYVGAGPLPLVLRRTYNSPPPLAEALPGSFGANWSHSYSAHIRPLSSTSLQLVRADAKTLVFDLQDGLWRSSPDVHSVLLPVVDEGESLSGWRYMTGSDEVETYDVTGKLLSITTRAGLTQRLGYDAQGRLETVADPFGRTLTFAYDGERISSVTDPASGRYSYEYDNDNLKSVTGPDGKKREYLYENSVFPHALTGVIDENEARFATFAYDSQGRADSSEHAGGADRVSVGYQANGDTTVTDALGTTQSYEYREMFGVERTSTARKPKIRDGAVTGTVTSAWTYDKDGNLKSYTDYRGNRTEFTYDLSRNLESSRTEAAGTLAARTITTEWHKDFRLPTKITEPNRVSNFERDSRGNLITQTVTDANTGDSRTWSFEYDDHGQVTRIDGPRTDVDDITTYEYDDKGNLKSLTNAAGHVTEFGRYDEHGRPREMKDPNGLTTILTYDERGRLKSGRVGAELTEYEYDGVGQLIELRRPDGRSFVFTYDGARRLTKVTDNLGTTITYTLDDVGNPVLEELHDSAGNLRRTHTRSFDALNRLKSTVGAEGQATSFVYDDSDNLISITDPLDPNHKTPPWFYDPLDRLTSRVDLNEGRTEFSYDANDRLTIVSDPVIHRTFYGYDGLDNLISVESLDTGFIKYAYDDVGNVKSREGSDGRVASYVYDALNRVTHVLMPTGNPLASFDYDQGQNGIGRLTRMVDTTGTTQWTYDAHGRVRRKVQEFPELPRSVQTNYDYDDATGLLQSITYPSGQVVRLTYLDGQVTEISARGGPLLKNIEYEPFGRANRWNWGDENDPINDTPYFQHSNLDGQVDVLDLGGGRTRELRYDRAGRIEAVIDNGETPIGYDAAGRLTEFVATNFGATTLELDRNGNRLSVTSDHGTDVYTYDRQFPTVSNRVRSIAGPNARTYEYDAAGNVISITTSSNITKFDYDDIHGRLIGASNAQGITEYRINGLGQRVSKLGPDTTRYFAHDEAGRLIGEYDHRGLAVQEFVYLDDMLVTVLRREGPLFVYPDHLGAPRAIADTNGTVVWRWDSDPFGATPPDEDPNRNGSKFTFNPRFPGQYFDQETGLFHNGFRDYDPQTGRYIQPDPIGLDGGLNPYLYAEGNPLTFFDPQGLGATTDGSSDSTDDGESAEQCGGAGAAAGADTGKGGGPAWPAQVCKNACSDMADVAQVVANQAIASNPGNLAAALSDFDSAFSQLYYGRALQSKIDALKLYNYSQSDLSGASKGGGMNATITPSYNRRAEGFAPQFVETPAGDQTHHFAAYLSAGINRQYTVASLHRAGDLIGENTRMADVYLADVAYVIGESLSIAPIFLKHLGDVIRGAVCTTP
jgi:RHS repeat-associated protein